ncbi:MAG: SspB family protein [Caulobacteraceae bacterium]
MVKETKPNDLMGYEALHQEALRGVVRAALARAAQSGLPGEHHFYISFRTGAKGAEIPGELRTKYPEEMTIVLQNQFWDLEPGEAAFSVTLQFGGQPKRLVIPYGAISRFWDPSVQFMLALAPGPESEPETSAKSSPGPGEEADKPKIVSLDQFRKKQP